MANETSMASLISSGKDIDYLSKDFDSFKQNLVNYTKSYYSGTYKDFSENSTGMMFIELASYVGDVLSYYIDYQFKEGFMQYASERKNIVTLANYLGYKIRTSIAATAVLEVYQLVPSKVGEEGTHVPDYKYALMIHEGMEVTSTSGTIFRTTAPVMFNENTSGSERILSVYDRDDTGQPTFYLLKKMVGVSAGTLSTMTVNVGSPQEFFEITLSETNVLEIASVVDADGNYYYEVPYLAQDTIMVDEPNNNKTNPIYARYADEVPYMLKYIRTSRRFTTIVNQNNTTTLEFGAGSDKFDDEIITPNLNNIGTTSSLDMPYDPANFLKSDSYGSAPANTTLTVSYYIGGGVESNVESNTLNTISTIEYGDGSEYLEAEDLVMLETIKTSVNVNNPEPALGGKSTETDEEIRLNGLASFSTQNRAVTRDDYIVRAYAMPNKFGSVAKAYVTKDGILDSQTQLDLVKLVANDDVKITPNGMNTVYGELNNPFAINMYVLSYNNDKQLIRPNELVLKNLKSYLGGYRLLTDGLNITNAFVINVGVNFEISTMVNQNKKDVVFRAMSVVTDFFEISKWSIGQPIEIGALELELAKVSGVMSVIDLEIVNLNVDDGDYSVNEYNMETATVGKTIYPSMDPSIFELKYPTKDIVGRAV